MTPQVVEAPKSRRSLFQKEPEKITPPAPDFMQDMFSGPVPPKDMVAGALAAGVVKIPVTTNIANAAAIAVSVPGLEIPSLSDGSAANSWLAASGGAIQSIYGDLTIGESSRSVQRRRGASMQAALNDDNQAMAVLGREWREFQIINNTNIPGGTLTMVPARDTHRIFIYRDNATMAFSYKLAAAGLKAGMKFMFVNLSASETNGTNEQQTITIDAAAGTFTITFGGSTTTPIAWNALAATVKTALEALPTIGVGNIDVGLASLVYTLTFKNALGDTNVAAVTTNAALLTGGANTAVVATTVPGVAAQGQLYVDVNGAVVLSATTYRFKLSRGAVLVLEALPPTLATTLSAQYAIMQKLGTVTQS